MQQRLAIRRHVVRKGSSRTPAPHAIDLAGTSGYVTSFKPPCRIPARPGYWSSGKSGGVDKPESTVARQRACSGFPLTIRALSAIGGFTLPVRSVERAFPSVNPGVQARLQAL